LVLMVAGCRSPWIQCTIVNHEAAPVSLVEVNYPGGSFGVQTIAAGASYHYRFHSLSTDTVSLSFTDTARQSHTVTGPELKQNQEGSLSIDIQAANQVRWTPALTDRR
jgi:VCBS repeat-containing protein